MMDAFAKIDPEHVPGAFMATHTTIDASMCVNRVQAQILERPTQEHWRQSGSLLPWLMH